MAWGTQSFLLLEKMDVQSVFSWGQIFKSPPRGSPLYWVAAIISRHGGGEAVMDVEDGRSLLAAVMRWVRLLARV